MIVRGPDYTIVVLGNKKMAVLWRDGGLVFRYAEEPSPLVLAAMKMMPEHVLRAVDEVLEALSRSGGEESS